MMASLQYGINTRYCSIIVLNPSHQQTWPWPCNRGCLMFCLWFSLPAPQDKVYLQQSLAVVKKKEKKSCQTTVSSFFTLSDTLELDAFRGEKKHHLAVDCNSDASIFLLLLPRCLWLRAACVHVGLAVVSRTCYCGESNNVMLFETYSAYQRFFCCTYSSTLTPFCCCFFTAHRSREVVRGVAIAEIS